MSAGLAASTVAPGSTAPEVSFTVPATDGSDCAYVTAGSSSAPRTTIERRLRIHNLLHALGRGHENDCRPRHSLLFIEERNHKRDSCAVSTNITTMPVPCCYAIH